ncbi:MAG: amidohydrolase family protein [Acidimicrobiales bacterium]
MTPSYSPIVDAHVHLKPGKLGHAIRAFFEANIGDQLQYPLDHRIVLDTLASEGVDTVWNLPYAHKPGMAAALNRDMIATSATFADHPVTVIPGCTVHPDDPDPAADLEVAARAGARVLKLHCSVGNYEVDDPRLSGTLDAAGAFGLPVVVHAGHAVSGMTGADELAPIGRAAADHPDTILVLAHFGHAAANDAVPYLDRHANLYADLTPVVHSQVDIGVELLARYADRILLGSDAPNTGCRVGTLIERVVTSGIDEAGVAAILGGNARRLVPVD